MPSLVTAAEVQSDRVQMNAELGADECFAVLFRHRKIAVLVCKASRGFYVELKDYE